MEEQNCTIGLDIGTTSLKAVAYRHDGMEIVNRTVRIDIEYLESGGAVQDPEAIYASVVSVLKQVEERARRAGYSVTALGFSAAMHSIIPISNNNTALFPAMTWLDSRPKMQAQELWQTTLGKDVYRNTGTPVHAMAPIVKIKWFQATYPELFQRTRRFASIKEYIWHRWFGVWEIDESIASATGMFQLGSHSWYEEALNYAGISASQLSIPVLTTHVRNGIKEPALATTPFDNEVKFCIGGSDGVLATLAADAIQPHTMLLTMGTSLAVRSGFHRPITDINTRSFCYVLDEDNYVIGAPSNSGGVVLDWLYRNVLTIAGENFDIDFPKLVEAAANLDTEELYCIPYVSGERAPLWNESAACSFVGLRLEHQQAHMMRAAIEGVLFNAFWIVSSMIEQIGTPKRLILSGRLFSFSWVRQFCADLFGLPITSQKEIDGATLGAAMWANHALSLSPIPPTQIYGPVEHPNFHRHQQLLKRFKHFQALCYSLLE